MQPALAEVAGGGTELGRLLIADLADVAMAAVAETAAAQLRIRVGHAATDRRQAVMLGGDDGNRLQQALGVWWVWP